MRPTFDLCQTKLKIELESCRRRFRTYSGAFRIGGQKKVVFFSQISMAPSIVEVAPNDCLVVSLQFGIAYRYYFLVLTYRGLLSHDTQAVKVFSDFH